ncbi:MAG: 5-formyltetrahydrofolate cyclo-ligase [Chitinophagaceae bacterium]|jgi:5-formyltetrahydrofolate cyclo-ligase|nr:5-formyltetrahydrofolate cyclo-ligase [Chitinophagaceae bacterium]
MSSKKELRKSYLEKRAALSTPEKHALLASMVDKFLEIDWKSSDLGMSFKSILKKNEVSADIFETVLIEEGIVQQFCYPSVRFSENEMLVYLDDEFLTWEEAPFGLIQPKSGNLVEPADIDVVLVPLLAFDIHGNRLGYGKGYYDRFLATCREDVMKVGLSWFNAETIIPEIHASDVPLNYCVTPQQLYVF